MPTSYTPCVVCFSARYRWHTAEQIAERIAAALELVDGLVLAAPVVVSDSRDLVVDAVEPAVEGEP